MSVAIQQGGTPVQPAKTPVAGPQPKTEAAPKPAASAANAPASSADKVNLSTNANEGTSSVTVDGWKKGKNDCLEHILINQGYSMNEIYGKGTDGKSMLQNIAAQNGLKDPNVLRPGQKLNIPKKGEAASTEGLKPGEKAEAKVDTGERSTKLTAERSDDGKKMTTEVNNGGASVEVKTEVGDKGRIDANVRRDGDNVTTQEVAKNSNGSAITQTTTKAGPEGTQVSIRDTDKTGPNSKVNVDDRGNVTVNNPGAKENDGVRTQVGNNQGLAERVGEWGDNVGRWITGERRADEAVEVNNAGAVNVDRRQDGSQTVTITDAQGDKTVHNRNADWALQRGGRWVDEQASRLGSWVSSWF
jgi:hypothetical protein